MEDLVGGLDEAVDVLRARLTVGHGIADAPAGLAPAQLVAALDALGALGRRLDGLRALVAAEVDRASRPELGADALAKQHGHRSAAAFIAAVTGIARAEAHRLVALGQAIAPRTSLVGAAMPARHPHLAAAVAAGRLGALAAGVIVAMLQRIALRSVADAREQAERILSEQAVGMPLDDVRALVRRAEAWLDPDGVEPDERDRRGQRYLRLFERDGFLLLDGKIDTVTGAPVKTAIEALVSAVFRHGKYDVLAGDDDALRPTVAQLQADALVQLARHGLSCKNGDLPLDGVTVVVRMSLETLHTGEGLAEIDGITEPVSVGSARILAASAGIIPTILGGDSETLDWGRRKRLFTPAQKLALVERDGGCAVCHLPPGMTKAHHLNWRLRDHGNTNIDEGATRQYVLLGLRQGIARLPSHCVTPCSLAGNPAIR